MRAFIVVLILSTLSATSFADIESLRSEAMAAATAGDSDLAISKLNELVEQSPDDGAAYYQLGTLIMDNNGDIAESVAAFERASELEFQTLGVAYRLSRIYARNGEAEKAFEKLDEMIKGGFGLPHLVAGHIDYNSISDDPRFEAALVSFRALRYPCEGDERHRAFDFWIGEWTVTMGGQFAGTNSIKPILGHCVIFEEWQGASGTTGKSFNYYDPGHDHWRQIWVGDSGTFIEFTGEARDGGIYYTAETINPADGAVTRHKFEFTEIEDDNVRQYWETSSDDGESWQTVWDGRYAPKTESE